MAFFPDDMPRPEPDWDDRDFWKHCAEQHLRFQACGACGVVRHPPRPMCACCQSTNVTWVDAPTEGTVYSYNVVHYVSHPAVATRVPYVGAVVEFPEVPGVRLVTNVTEVDPASMEIDMRVSLWWDDIGDGMHVPRFRPI
jgi:uncharacterized OB-fold protein